jgi:hypothetical protein
VCGDAKKLRTPAEKAGAYHVDKGFSEFDWLAENN